MLCKTEISNLNVDIVHVLAVKQYILQFDVPVHDPLPVQVAQPKKDLVYYESGFLFFKLFNSF